MLVKKHHVHWSIPFILFFLVHKNNNDGRLFSFFYAEAVSATDFHENESSLSSMKTTQAHHASSHLYDSPTEENSDKTTDSNPIASFFQPERRALYHPVDYGGMHPFEIYQRQMFNDDNDNEQEREQYVRRQQYDPEDVYQPIRIHMDTTYLEELVVKDIGTKPHVDYLISTLIPAVKKFWTEALTVFPVVGDISVPEAKSESCAGGAGSWSGYDLVVFVFAEQEQCQKTVGRELTPLAFASNCLVDQFDRPLAGFTSLCFDSIDLDSDTSKRQFMDTVLHEFAHILGFNAADMPFFRNSTTGEPLTPRPIQKKSVICVDGNTRSIQMPSNNTVREYWTSKGEHVFEVATEKVTQVARNQFGCDKMTGAKLENQPTRLDACFGSHWDHRHYNSEFLTAVATTTDQVLSPLTLALLEDSGWYRPNYAAAKISSFGHGAGCDFVYEDCIINGSVPTYSKGIFCTEVEQFGCGPGHRAVAACDLTTYSDDLGELYQYFDDPRLGGTLRQLDYCPTFSITNFVAANDNLFDASEEKVVYQLDCSNPDSQDIDLFCFPGETFGSSSRCFETNLVRPHCFESRCNEEKHAVEVIFGETVLTCDYDGQELPIPGVAQGTFICPKLEEICPDLICRANCCGRGRCDYSRKNPECICFDENNSSPYCAPFELPITSWDTTNNTVSCNVSTEDETEKVTTSDGASYQQLNKWWFRSNLLFIAAVHFLFR